MSPDPLDELFQLAAETRGLEPPAIPARKIARLRALSWLVRTRPRRRAPEPPDEPSEPWAR